MSTILRETADPLHHGGFRCWSYVYAAAHITFASDRETSQSALAVLAAHYGQHVGTGMWCSSSPVTAPTANTHAHNHPQEHCVIPQGSGGCCSQIPSQTLEMNAHKPEGCQLEMRRKATAHTLTTSIVCTISLGALMSPERQKLLPPPLSSHRNCTEICALPPFPDQQGHFVSPTL